MPAGRGVRWFGHIQYTTAALICVRPRVAPCVPGQSEYFKQPFVSTLQFLDELALKDKDEKMRFFQTLSTVISTFPSQACKYKVWGVTCDV